MFLDLLNLEDEGGMFLRNVRNQLSNCPGSEARRTKSSYTVVYRGGGWVFQPPSPKFRSFDKFEPDCNWAENV